MTKEGLRMIHLGSLQRPPTMGFIDFEPSTHWTSFFCCSAPQRAPCAPAFGPFHDSCSLLRYLPSPP